jgi:hypothetical protein
MKTIQLPDDVYQRASKLAEQDHVSVGQVGGNPCERWCRRVGQGCRTALPGVPSRSLSAFWQR